MPEVRWLISEIRDRGVNMDQQRSCILRNLKKNNTKVE